MLWVWHYVASFMASCGQIYKEVDIKGSLRALCVLSKTLLTFILNTATMESKEKCYHVVLHPCSGPNWKMFTTSTLFFIFQILILKEICQNLCNPISSHSSFPELLHLPLGIPQSLPWRTLIKFILILKLCFLRTQWVWIFLLSYTPYQQS